MTWSKSGVRPSYISAWSSASGRDRDAAVLAGGDDVERRVGVVLRRSPLRPGRDQRQHRSHQPDTQRRIPCPFRPRSGRPGRSLVCRTYIRSRRACARVAAAYARRRCSGPTPASLVLLAAATLIGQAICRRLRAAALVAAWRRRSGSRRSARSPGGRCGCRGRGPRRSSPVGLATVLAGLYLRAPASRAPARRCAAAVPLVLAAIALASLPFIVEGRFGILGTGLNPDMSQHLFAVDRLAAGGSERLIADGYPLGPHSIVVALSTLGPSTVAGLRRPDDRDRGRRLPRGAGSCSRELGGWRRLAGALCVGFAYLVAAYLVQGAFKETIAGAVRARVRDRRSASVARGWTPPRGPAARCGRCRWRCSAVGQRLRLQLPRAALARRRARRSGRRSSSPARRAAAAPPRRGCWRVWRRRPCWSRSRRWRSRWSRSSGGSSTSPRFETFDPAGAGLGNLFDRLSPLEALGIWPSGDFRVEPGDGAVPGDRLLPRSALAGLAALAYGLRWSLRRGERALPAALAAAALLWLYALLAGTPYQEAKALVMVAPLVAVLSVRALVASQAPALVAIAFLAAAGGSSVLALVNGPVGPSGYSTALADLRGNLPRGSTVVAVPDELLADQHAARLHRLGAARQPNLRRAGLGPRAGARRRGRGAGHGRPRRRRRDRAQGGGDLPGGGRAGAVPADPGRRPRRSERGRLTGTALTPARARSA